MTPEETLVQSVIETAKKSVEEIKNDNSNFKSSVTKFGEEWKKISPKDTTSLSSTLSFFINELIEKNPNYTFERKGVKDLTNEVRMEVAHTINDLMIGSDRSKILIEIVCLIPPSQPKKQSKNSL